MIAWPATHGGLHRTRGTPHPHPKDADPIGSRTDFSHILEMFDDANMRSGLYPCFHIALLNDFGSFALCMSDRLFDSAHSSTASPAANYNMRHVSAFKWREQVLFTWLFVHGMYHYTG